MAIQWDRPEQQELMSLFLMPLKTVFCGKLGEGRRGMNTCRVFLGLFNLSGITKREQMVSLLYYGNPYPAKQI